MMNNAKKAVQRKHPVHGVKEITQQATILFVTVTTRDRRHWVATAEVHELLRTVWTRATGWRVGYYLLMPDHLHFFVSPGDLDISLEQWGRYWKSLFAKEHKQRSDRWLTDH